MTSIPAAGNGKGTGKMEGENQAQRDCSANDGQIINLVNDILTKAVQEGASHIHIEPLSEKIQIRLRKDGVLAKPVELPAETRDGLVTRLKILAGLNITERRVPQSGRLNMEVRTGKTVDFRVHSIPYLAGEGAAVRILNKDSSSRALNDLGMGERESAIFKNNLSRAHGLLLCSGLADSGKTTTLYSALASLNPETQKIVTVEDPVEVPLLGIQQMAFRHEVGLTFAAAMRTFLQPDVDADVIMISDLRDAETVSLAAKAVTRGKLVLAGMYADDCVLAVTRLLNLGLEPSLLTSTVNTILSQRLVRRLCPICKEPAAHDPEDLHRSGFTTEQVAQRRQLFIARGCPQCSGLGYSGRIGIFELMEMRSNVARAIRSRASEEDLRAAAFKDRMASLRQAGISKALDGMTSLEEVLRCTFDYRVQDNDH
ncbi:MAG: type II/IV secretion system protein [Desulforudis sp.]|nr:MAG: type II/IV secretion system protein [Desulforudis sp.]